MYRCLSSALLYAIVATAPCLNAQVRPGEALVEVNAARIVKKIPTTIFGTFLEPIGNSIYGGLWAQLLENPSFEENLWSVEALNRKLRANPALVQSSGMGLPVPWEPLEVRQGWRYESRWGDAANSSRSLLIMALPERETGVRQEVFLPVHRCRTFDGSIYVKAMAGPAVLSVSIRRRNEPSDILAKAEIRAAETSWTKHDFTLALQAGGLHPREPADFVISLANEARVLVDQAFLWPADAIQGMDPEMIALCRTLQTPVLRFGGNFTSGYHWRDGIGPVDKRVSMLNQPWGMPEYNHFGTDEFLQFCRLIGAEPQVALNLGSGTPEEAAGWVQYINERWGNRKGALLWELGNELWGDFQIGCPTISRVAARTKAFSDAVRAVDPLARLIATGGDPDSFEKWNAEQLRIAPGPYDYLSTHFVVGDQVLKANPSLDFLAQAQLALPVGLERRLRLMRELVDADPRTRGRVRFAFTEWLFHGGDLRVPNFNNMGGALCTAGFLNALIRVSDFTPIADMTGLIEFGGVWKKKGIVFGVPAYWAFRMYSASSIDAEVESRTQVETYDVKEGNRRIPDIPGVPYLDLVAGRNAAGDRLMLYCVNRNTRTEIRATIRIYGFACTSAKASELMAGSIYETNDEIHPDAIRPRERKLVQGGSLLKHTFPPASVTVIELTY